MPRRIVPATLDRVVSGNFELNRQSSLADGLRAWWPMPGSRGMDKVRDFSGRGSNGTFDPTHGTWQSDPNSGFGFELPNNTTIGRTSFGDVDVIGDLTVMTWVRPLVKFPERNTSWVNKWQSGSEEWSLAGNYITASTNYFPYFTIRIGGSVYVASHTTQWQVGEWLFVCGIRRGTQLEIYRSVANGAYLLGNAAACGAGNINSTNIPVRVGEFDNYGNANTNARYGDIAMWERALSLQEVQRLFDVSTRFEMYAPIPQIWPVPFVVEEVGSGELAGSSAGTSSVLGTLTASGNIDGNSDGQATVSGSLSGILDLVGSSAGSATVEAALTLIGVLSGSSDGVSLVSGSLYVELEIAGSSDGLSTVSATLSATGTLSGQVDAASTVSGSLKSIREIAGSSEGVATAEGTLSASGELTGSSEGIATVSATLLAEGRLEGDSVGSAVVSGTLSSDSELSADASGTSLVVGTLRASGVLLGSSDGEAVSVGDISGQIEISGTSSGLSTASGSLYSEFSIAGSVTASSNVSGVLSGLGNIAGDIEGLAVVSGTLNRPPDSIAGSSEGTSTVQAALSAIASIVGTADGQTTVEGSLYSPLDLVGSSTGTSSTVGSLVGQVEISGTVSGVSTLTATLLGQGNLSGSAIGISSVSGTFLVDEESLIEGSSAGTAQVEADLSGIGYLSGLITGIVVVSGSVEVEGLGDSVPMLSAGIWKKSQPNTILFVLIDSSGNEVTGLGDTFSLLISKAGNTFAASSGTKSEVGNGWYKYVSTVAEADTSGPVALVVTGSGIIQQNLEYVVEDRVVTAIEFEYTVTSSVGSTPIPGADVSFSVNANPSNVVWSGVTDAFGVARDLYGNLPRLVPGTYYIFSNKPGYVFEIDQETVD